MSVAGPAAPSGTRTEEAWAEDGRDWRADPRNDGPPDLLTGFRFPAGYVVGPGDDGAEISREEYAEIDVRGGWQTERAGGRLVVMPKVGPAHRRAAKPFRFHLGGYWHQNPDLIEDFDLEGWLYTDDGSDRHPDAFVFLRDSPLAAGGVELPERAPDLVFEVVSRDRRDRERDYVQKRAEYHARGVREYIIVDRFDRAVTVLRWEPDGYAEAAVLGPGDAYTSPLLPGLSVPLAEAIGGGE